MAPMDKSATTVKTIAFNKPYMTGRELSYIAQAHQRLHLSGNGYFTKACHAWLEKTLKAPKVLLSHSGTAALEMAAILAGIQPGDEVIMPSYTFVSTANAFVMRGAVPVFVDIRLDTLNLDESLIEAAVTPRTKAIVPVHYAGVACDMDVILDISRRHRLWVIEDAAHGVLASARGRQLGSFGHLAALSFHETKNIICGEGGALAINDPALLDRASVIWEKGTNREAFLHGRVDKYSWVDIGSSFLPNELTAAFLFAQMESAEDITQRRRKIWDAYHHFFTNRAERFGVTLPKVAEDCVHNGHMYYLLFAEPKKCREFMGQMKHRGIEVVSHYVPLHSAPAGLRYGRAHGNLKNTDYVAERIVRLPLWIGLEEIWDDLLEPMISVLESL